MSGFARWQQIDEIDGAFVFHGWVVPDERGYFSRTLDDAWLRQCGVGGFTPAQDSVSRSHQSVVRGLRKRDGEAKLVRCACGSVFDVLVDLRRGSPTFRNVYTLTLHDTDPATVYIPAGCAHGFQALTEPADVTYRIDRPHDPTAGLTIAWDDPELAIAWPLPPAAMSAGDISAPLMRQVVNLW